MPMETVTTNNLKYNIMASVCYLSAPTVANPLTMRQKNLHAQTEHLAYTIIEEDIVDKVNDAWREAEE